MGEPIFSNFLYYKGKYFGKAPIETNETIKEKYEANPNTNAFTDDDKQALDALDPSTFVSVDQGVANAGKILGVSSLGTVEVVDAPTGSGTINFKSFNVTGNGILDEFIITHNLGTKDIIVQAYDTGNGNTVEVSVQRSTNTTLKIISDVPIPSGSTLKILLFVNG
jgi:hypothetical protein